MKTETSICVVHDDSNAREALASLLRSRGYAVEIFGSPQAFLAAVDRLRPACAVIEHRIPEPSGLDVQAALEQAKCEVPPVFVTSHGDVRTAVQAMKRGAVDFLLEPVDSAELLHAVERAAARDARARAKQAAQRSLSARLAALSPREREVCQLVVRGLLNKQIAAELGLSEPTVKEYRARGMVRLGVGSVGEMAGLFARARDGAS